MHNPTEHVQEHVTHEASHGGHDDHSHGNGRWITAAALTAAILAAFAAIGGALSNHHLSESTHLRIDENDKWSYYQSKSLKNYLLQAKNDIVDAAIPSNTLSAKVKAKMESDKKKYDENEEIKTKTESEATLLDLASKKHFDTHEDYELAETMFHISIAIVAVAVVAKRRVFWHVSLVTGMIGLLFFLRAYAHAPLPEKSEAKEAPASHPAAGEGAAHPSADHEKAPAEKSPDKTPAHQPPSTEATVHEAPHPDPAP